MWIGKLILLCMGASFVACEEIQVQQGDDIHFQLPGYEECGQFSLLDPQLKPVVIIEGRGFPNIIGQYEGRSTVDLTDTGLNLTIGQATISDTGDYTLAVSSREVLHCNGISFRVLIRASSTPADENLGVWGEWSTCQKSCDPASSQYRTRKCVTSGACSSSDASNETRTCDQAQHCPRWTEWGNWSNCSAKCGKGFRIRKRVCVNGNSALLKSTECHGPPTQSILCMTVCEGYWDPWSAWGNCTSDCGGGTRKRTRQCVSDSRVTKTSCDGDREQSEVCNETPCATETGDSGETSTITTSSTIVVQDEAEPLNLAVVVIVSCIAGIVLVVVLVIILRKRCAENKAVDAIAVRKDKGRRKPKTSTASAGGGSQKEQSGVNNLYSELSSSFVYPASEFESVFFEDASAGAQSVHVPTLENIDEVAGDDEEEEDGGNDGEFDSDNDNNDEEQDTSVNCVEENERNKKEESKDNKDWLYVVPPEEESGINATSDKVSFDIPVVKLDLDTVSEIGSVYYEPPETPKSVSKKISTVSAVSVKYAKPGEYEKERKESVYENISDVQRETTDDDDTVTNERALTPIPDYNESSNVSNDSGESSNNQLIVKDNAVEMQNESVQQSEVARRKEWEALYNKHIYVNYPERPVITICEPNNDDPEEIYDVPTFKD